MKTIPKRMQLDFKWLGLPLVTGGGFDSFRKPIGLGPHAHKGYEITYLTDGEVTWQTETGENLHLSGGKIAITQPGVLHEGEWRIIRPCVLYWVIYEPSGEQAASCTPFDPTFLKESDANLHQVGNTVAEAGQRLGQLFEMWRGFLQAFNQGERGEILKAQMRTILVQIYIEMLISFQSKAAHPSIPLIERAGEFMQAHLEEKISIKDVAEYLHLHPKKFHALFKAQTGQTPADYLQRMRCTQARKDLLSSSESITQIGLRLGFSSSQYFATCFRKYTGITPKEFRIKFAKKPV